MVLVVAFIRTGRYDPTLLTRSSPQAQEQGKISQRTQEK